HRLELATTPADVLSAALDEVILPAGYSNVWAYVFSQDGSTATLIDTRGERSEEGAQRFPVLRVTGDAYMEALFAATQPVIVEDAQTDPRSDKAIVAQL